MTHLIKRAFLLIWGMMFCTIAYSVQMRRDSSYKPSASLASTDRDNPILWSHSKTPYITRAAAPGSYAINDATRIGEHEYLVVLVNFKDVKFTIKDKNALLERYNNIFNAADYSDNAIYTYKETTFYGAHGSVASYFRDQSYGIFKPHFKIIGPITVSKGYAYYGQGKDEHASELAQEVCDSLVNGLYVNLKDYSNDSGSIDQLFIIYAGRGENYEGADVNTIWPHASATYYYNVDKNLYLNYIRYACSCELFWDSDTILDGIGVFCHEFSHTLGLPDFYRNNSSNDSNFPMGYWSIMDYGCYENLGFSPVGYTAFEKYSLGWLQIEEISQPGEYLLQDISQQPDLEANHHSAYRLSTKDDNRFILLENHQQAGWYKHHATQGLMVTAIDYNTSDWEGNTVNDSYSLNRYQILAADNDYSLNTNMGDLFPYDGMDSITVNGKPSLSVNETPSPYSLYDICSKNGIVTFRASTHINTATYSPTNQEITISSTHNLITISAPANKEVCVYDLSGRVITQSVTDGSELTIPLPRNSIWIVRCGNITRKVRN